MGLREDLDKILKKQSLGILPDKSIDKIEDNVLDPLTFGHGGDVIKYGTPIGIVEELGGDEDPRGRFYSQMSTEGDSRDLAEDQAEMAGPASRFKQNIKDRWTQNPAENPLQRPMYRFQDRIEDRNQNRGMRLHNRANFAEQTGRQGKADRLNNRAGEAFGRSLQWSDHGPGTGIENVTQGGLLASRLRGLLGRG